LGGLANIAGLGIYFEKVQHHTAHRFGGERAEKRILKRNRGKRAGAIVARGEEKNFLARETEGRNVCAPKKASTKREGGDLPKASMCERKGQGKIPASCCREGWVIQQRRKRGKNLSHGMGSGPSSPNVSAKEDRGAFELGREGKKGLVTPTP